MRLVERINKQQEENYKYILLFKRQLRAHHRHHHHAHHRAHHHAHQRESPSTNVTRAHKSTSLRQPVDAVKLFLYKH